MMFKLLNIFRRPINKDILDDWAKLTLDCAKVAVLAIPVLLYGNETFLNKVIYSIVLALLSYFLLFISRMCRDIKPDAEGEL